MSDSHAHAAAQDLPYAFLQMLERVVPEAKLQEVLDSFATDKAVTFRVQPFVADPKLTLKELQQAGLSPEPIEWSSHTYRLGAEHRQALSHHPTTSDGRIYIQGLSSLLPGYVLQPLIANASRMLDLCAAPGGKTLHLASLIDQLHPSSTEVRFDSVEAVRQRFFRLQNNVKLAQRFAPSSYIHLHHTDGSRVGRHLPETFDFAIVDAPCTGEARFDPNDPATFAFWHPKKTADMNRKQKSLLRSAIDATRIDGHIVYATCTLSPEENEAILSHTLKRLGDAISIEPMEIPLDSAIPAITNWRGKTLDPTITNAQRILPTAEHDAFFIALIRKHRSTSSKLST